MLGVMELRPDPSWAGRAGRGLGAYIGAEEGSKCEREGRNFGVLCGRAERDGSGGGVPENFWSGVREHGSWIRVSSRGWGMWVGGSGGGLRRDGVAEVGGGAAVAKCWLASQGVEAAARDLSQLGSSYVSHSMLPISSCTPTKVALGFASRRPSHRPLRARHPPPLKPLTSVQPLHALPSMWIPLNMRGLYRVSGT